MRCPLITVSKTWGDEDKGKEADRCIQSECSWWMQVSGVCAVLGISHVLTALSAQMVNLSTIINERRR